MNLTAAGLKNTVAGWVRGWLPFVLVTKGGWLGFQTVQDGIDYAATHSKKLILVGPGDFAESVTIGTGADDDDTWLVGCGHSSKITGDGSGAAVTLGGDRTGIVAMTVSTEAGGVGGGGHAIAGASGIDKYVLFVNIPQSDLYGIDTNGTNKWWIIGCKIENTDGAGIHCDGTSSSNGSLGTIIALCRMTTIGGHGVSLHNGNGDNTMVVCNSIRGAGNDGIYISSSDENCVIVGNRITGSGNENIDDDSSTSTVTGNDTT